MKKKLISVFCLIFFLFSSIYICALEEQDNDESLFVSIDKFRRQLKRSGHPVLMAGSDFQTETRCFSIIFRPGDSIRQICSSVPVLNHSTAIESIAQMNGLDPMEICQKPRLLKIPVELGKSLAK